MPDVVFFIQYSLYASSFILLFPNQISRNEPMVHLISLDGLSIGYGYAKRVET